jgi:putative phage-type endonuclease
MNESEWLEWRMEGVGASDAPVIMGVSPWKTPYQLWKEKVFKEIITLENVATQHGKENEDHALAWLEEKTGELFFPQIRAASTLYPWMRATLDGWALDTKVACEIKCPYHLANHQKVKRSLECPAKYYPQIQHQLYVANLQKMIFLSFNVAEPEDSVWFFVSREEKYIEELIRREKEFWECVQRKTSPDKLERDLQEEKNDEEWNQLPA